MTANYDRKGVNPFVCRAPIVPGGPAYTDFLDQAADFDDISHDQYSMAARKEYKAMLIRLLGKKKRKTWQDDFDGISKVTYDASETRAVTLAAHPVLGDAVGMASIYTRDNIIRSIHAGATFIMLHKDRDGLWVHGPRIFVVTVNGKEYLKTGIDPEEADRLEFYSLA